MTTEQAIRAVKVVQIDALKKAANVALADVLPFVPIDRDLLRKSGKVTDNGQDVYIVFGDKSSGEVAKYAAYQYAKAERHYDTGGGVLGRLLQLFSGAPKRAAKGKANKARYTAAYRAVKNQLERFPGGVRWFKRLLRADDTHRKMARVYANALRGALRG
jgi:hypothetical protein